MEVEPTPQRTQSPLPDTRHITLRWTYKTPVFRGVVLKDPTHDVAVQKAIAALDFAIPPGAKNQRRMGWSSPFKVLSLIHL